MLKNICQKQRENHLLLQKSKELKMLDSKEWSSTKMRKSRSRFRLISRIKCWPRGQATSSNQLNEELPMVVDKINLIILDYIFYKSMLTPSLARSAAKTHVDFISGPVRIKDALYMGDEIAAKDMDFIASNKVTHIINTVVKRVPNLYEKYGVQYLSVNWTQKQANIFDKKNNAINMIFTFIEEAMEQGESVLVHSLHGKSRAGCVIIAYLMKKFSWSLQKTFDYVVSKKESFKIRSQFLSQLQQLQKRLALNSKLSTSWNVSSHEEDLIMVNTFKNTKIDATFEKTQPKTGKKKVSWGQKISDASTHRPTQNILTSVTKYKQYLQQFGIKPVKLKSILKNCDDGQGKNQQQALSNEEESIEKIDASPVMKNHTKQLQNSKRFEQERLTKSQAIGNNKISNQSYVIVNNFMSNERPKNERYSSIPTKQQKQKQKKLQSKSGSRLAPYQNIISTIKSPYDINFMNRIGENSKPRRRQDYQQYAKGQQRPNTVNDENPRGNSVRVSSSRTSNRQQGAYGNISNQKWPTQRQNIIRYK